MSAKVPEPVLFDVVVSVVTPVGTYSKETFRGVREPEWRGFGNCLHIRFADGSVAQIPRDRIACVQYKAKD